MIVRMNAPSRASILAKQKDGILLVHQDGVKPFSRTSQKVSIDLANETENRLLKSGKDMSFLLNRFFSIFIVNLFLFTTKLENISSLDINSLINIAFPILYFSRFQEVMLFLHIGKYKPEMTSIHTYDVESLA